MKFILPLPPSINQTYRVDYSASNGGLKKRKLVRDWEKEAGWKLKEQLLKIVNKARIFPLKEKIKIDIFWFFLKNRDIDSGIKVLLDFFEDHNIYENDEQVMYLKMEKQFDSKNPRVEVEITPYAVD